MLFLLYLPLSNKSFLFDDGFGSANKLFALLLVEAIEKYENCVKKYYTSSADKIVIFLYLQSIIG